MRVVLHYQRQNLWGDDFVHLVRVALHRQQLSLWGDASDGGRSTLGVHVGNLRRKLGEDPRSPRYLRTVRGTGYCLTG